MTDTPLGDPPENLDQQRLVLFLMVLRADLEVLVSQNPGDDRLFDDGQLRDLAREAFDENVSQALDRLIVDLIRNWPRREPRLRRHGLTGANLLFKTTLAERFRTKGGLDQTRSTKEVFANMARYLGVSSSILGSIKEAFDKLPWWMKFSFELIKEFVDMLEAQSDARS